MFSNSTVRWVFSQWGKKRSNVSPKGTLFPTESSVRPAGAHPLQSRPAPRPGLWSPLPVLGTTRPAAPTLLERENQVFSSGPLSPTANPYLSSALVKKILSWGFFAFREHTGRSSGYMKTLLVARVHATCFGKQGNSSPVRKQYCGK